MKASVGVAVLAALVLLAGALQLARSGYSPDEEFTVFAVKGIEADGLPILPSGLTYDRGVAYSYAAWVARAATGLELPAYRALSLASAMASLFLIFALVRRVSSDAAGLLATLLVATSVPFWAVATTGRFYAPFFATYVGALLALSTLGTGRTPGTPGTLGTLGTLAAVGRGLHELAFTLIAIPAVVFFLAPKMERRIWWRATLAVGAGLALAQVGIFALHYLAPFSGETMIRRFFLWQIVNLFEVPPPRQFGVALVAMVLAWLVAPRRAGLIAVAGLSGAAMVLAFALARATNTAPLSIELASAIAIEGSRYPLDMFWHIAREYPIAAIAGVGTLMARLAGAEWRAEERALHALWIGWVLWFGVIESGITVNYLLIPISMLLMVIAVDLTAILRFTIPASVPRGLAFRLVVTILALSGIVGDQWRGDGSLAERLEAARPTIVAPGIEDFRAGLQPSDRIACTDELACLLLVGRADAWLALDDYVRERFAVKMGDELPVGVYAGTPAVFRPADLFALSPDGTAPERTFVIDVFKEYPIGNSRSWLPRAIEADGLQVRPILETDQLRVLEVAPAQALARRQWK